jgi:hypothetical protein
MFGVSILVVVMVTVPYIYAFYAADSSHVFGGFLLNPIDGHSYLAKMYLGYLGEWKFSLPYTAAKGEGAFLFLFYIMLGHLARILNARLIEIFHLARLLGAIFLLWSVSRFIKLVFQSVWQRISWFVISTLGAGLGWIAVFFGLFTSDFWVAEAYPFLSMYASPHFTIGLGLMLLTLLPGRNLSILENFTLGVILGIIQPFNVIIVALIMVAGTIDDLTALSGTLKSKIGESGLLTDLISFGFGGGIILGYQYLVILKDPHLSIWNMQNITPSPQPLDLILSLSPCLILAVFGIASAWQSEKGKVLIFWAAISLVLIFIPWNLQRRFLAGIFMPVSGLAVLGLGSLIKLLGSSNKIASAMLLLLVLPTNIIVILSGQQAVNRKDQAVFWSVQLNEAFYWIENNTKKESIFLTDESTGLYIPSQTGRRVIYGHPFETIEADRQLDFIRRFYSRNYPVESIREELRMREVDFVIVGMESNNVNQDMLKNGFPIVFNNSGVVIYGVE